MNPHTHTHTQTEKQKKSCDDYNNKVQIMQFENAANLAFD